MRRLVAAGLAVLFVLLLGASAAYSQPQRTASYPGFVTIKMKGRGSVTLNRGFVQPQTLDCSASCPRTVRANIYQTRGPRSAVTEKPAKGWTFAGWRGFCKTKTRTCSINLSRVHPAPPTYGRFTAVTAVFIR